MDPHEALTIMSSTIKIVSALAAALLLTTATVQADDAPAAVDGEKKCIALQRIRNTKVIDNQHIRFELLGGKYYMNELPSKCPGLRKDKPFMYKTSLSQLCDLDIITVLEQTGGGYMQGASCGLGKFVPHDKDAKDKADKAMEATSDAKPV
jgi:hypothetical protein